MRRRYQEENVIDGERYYPGIGIVNILILSGSGKEHIAYPGSELTFCGRSIDRSFVTIGMTNPCKKCLKIKEIWTGFREL